MTLDSLLDRGDRPGKRFVVYAEETDTPSVDRFAAKNATVEGRRCPTVGADGFVVVRSDGHFLGAIALSELRAMLESPVVTPWNLDEVHEEHRTLFGLLEDTVFVSLDDRRVLVAAREIEEHAWRVGAGGLHVGVSSTDRFAAQRNVYGRLADETDIDLHVYAASVPDDAPEEMTFHTVPADVVEAFRFRAFDGCGDDARKCAFLARPTGSAAYEGFWTYRPGTVDDVLEAVRPGAG